MNIDSLPRLLRAAGLAVSVAALVTYSSGTKADDETVIQSANMVDANDESIVLAGAGILTRTEDGVHVSLHMTGLKKKSAYTAWWIVFNDPGECTLPCGLDDLIAGVGQGFFATGYVTGNDGTANVYAWLAVGPIPDGADRLSEFFGFDPATEPGLADGFDAEIHLVSARFHGKVKAGQAAAQIGSFDGACGPAPDYPKCADKQAIVFPAVNGG